MNKQILWRMNWQSWLWLAIALALMAVAFWGGIEELINRWDKQEEYSHGYMLPFITLYFIWQKKNIIIQSEFSPSWWGLALIVVALVVFVIGEVSALFILTQYALITVILGLALAIMGWPAIKPVLIPILLLVFAIPLPYFLEANLSANLQLLSSKLGVAFIRWCQIPVYLEGNVIDLGVYKLQVVEACSGLRYLFPLLSLGFICAYLFDVAFWKRVVLVLSTIPITILMNSFRIGMIGVLVDNWGIAMAEGFLHDFEGWIVFMACFGVLFIEMAILGKIGADKKPFFEIFGLSQASAIDLTISTVKTRPFAYPLVASAIALATSVAIVSSIDKRTEIIPSRALFPEFPTQLGSWHGEQDAMEETVTKYLGLTDYILANYKDDKSQTVNFYAAYYESQRKGVSPHSPRVCIPGGGWQISEITRTQVGDLPINRIVIKKEDNTQLVYYWFQQRGRQFANEYLMKWYLFKDALLLNRTDGALVRITTAVSPNENIADADNRLKGFAKQLDPVLPKFIPN
ncbi:VPLPA-CTERM-specific exosortase XrtD [Methyloglobulus sp.]|uniref:VPLPA-CTERM-specific exosortase XrtD n=1 Tax=Methyloglobulus sp. TaxID=2518622 RepID=UPI0032B84C6D